LPGLLTGFVRAAKAIALFSACPTTASVLACSRLDNERRGTPVRARLCGQPGRPRRVRSCTGRSNSCLRAPENWRWLGSVLDRERARRRTLTAAATLPRSPQGRLTAEMEKFGSSATRSGTSWPDCEQLNPLHRRPSVRQRSIRSTHAQATVASRPRVRRRA